MRRPIKYTALSELDFLRKPEEKQLGATFETAEKICFKTQYTSVEESIFERPTTIL